MPRTGAKQSTPSLPRRIADLPWPALEAHLSAEGWATTPPLLSPEECATASAWYADEDRFRKRIDMGRHHYGEGEYGYFRYPLPPLVQTLREGLYANLAPLAERWQQALGRAGGYPPRLADWLAQCHAAGQQRPTPLLLEYAAGGYNCLHQDRYGALAFPLQAAILLSRPGRDFAGGEFLLVETHPRRQSVGHVVPLTQGQMVLFPNGERPVPGKRGMLRVAVRHGVSRITRGRRHTLGLNFHDAA